MAKLLSGTRIYGTATVDTFLIVSGTATSTSTTTGAITVAGGVGIGGALYISTTSYIAGAQILTTATISSSGVSLLAAGTDTAVSAATGAVTIWNTGTLQSVTNRGWTTTNAINITNATAASTIASGALIVSGGIGVAGTVYASQLWGANQAGAASSNVDIRAGNGNWNISFLARAGGGNYNPVVQADDSLLYWTTGSQGTGNLVIAPWSSTATGIRITNTGSVFIPSLTNAISTTTGALITQGGAGIGRDLWVGGASYFGRNSTNYVSISGANSGASPSISFTSDAGGGYGVGAAQTHLFYNGGFLSLAVTGPGSGVQNYIRISGATSGTSPTLQTVAGLDTNVDLNVTTAGTGRVVVTNTVTSLSTNTGALVVQGGVGIWGNLWVGGTINGTASTATIGGNLGGGTAGQVPYQTGPSATSFFGPGTAGNVLVSNGTSAPTYNSTLVLAGTTVATSTSTGAFRVAGGVGIGGSVYIAGSLFATTKSFYIDHPTKPGMKLKYGSLEGPENGIYVRGKLDGRVIELPDYWTALVDPDSITVDLTPFGSFQQLYVEKIEDNKIYVSNAKMFTNKVSCFYTVWAERKDVEKLVVEAE